MSLIKDASPANIMLGTDDKSARPLPPPEPIQPQHLPYVMFWAKRGTTKKVLLEPNQLTRLYHEDTFDKDKKWYNHATRFMLGASGKGNALMVKRLVPEDAGAPSNVTVYLDLLPITMPNYKRTSQGQYKTDPSGAPEVDDQVATVEGYMVKFIKEYDKTNSPMKRKIAKSGTMSKNGQASTMYPIFEAKATNPGEDYNNIGFKIISLFGKDADRTIINKTKSLPFHLALMTRKNEKSSPEPLRSLFGEPSVQFTFKHMGTNPRTKARFDFETVFQQNWYNETDFKKAIRYWDMENLHFYRENYELVLKKITEKEKSFVTTTPKQWADDLESDTLTWYDYSGDETTYEDELYLINPFTCKTTKNVPYFTVRYAKDVDVNILDTQMEVNMSADTPVFLMGGSDGTLSNENFEALVKKEIAKYADPDSEVQDLAVNTESALWDSGFTLETKLALVDFIGLRKDTILHLSTHDDSLGESVLPLSESRAVAVALKTRLKLVPESTFYGTPVARAVIFAGAGNLRDGNPQAVPLTYEFMLKVAKMMGSGDGKWNTTYLFDGGSNAMIKDMINIRPEFIPASIKPTLWDDGLIWPQPFDRENFHFPGIQTVYDDDTSVLNNYYTIMAIAYCTKMGDRVWREFTGTASMTDEVFLEAVEARARELVRGKFGNVLTVIPRAEMLESDKIRGYSWRLVYEIYANNMKTKQIYTTRTFRSSDLPK